MALFYLTAVTNSFMSTCLTYNAFTSIEQCMYLSDVLASVSQRETFHQLL